MLLVAAAVVALIWANSPWSDSYFELWSLEFGIELDHHVLALNLKEWVNDLLMVLFFVVVGLEIKRELTEGELRDPRQAARHTRSASGPTRRCRRARRIPSRCRSGRAPIHHGGSPTGSLHRRLSSVRRRRARDQA